MQRAWPERPAAEQQDREVMTERVGSRVVEGIWVQEVGDGPLVVLVHGAMDRAGGMLRVRRALEPTCRVLRYDRRGYARSLGTGPPTSFDQQVDDLALLLDGRPAVVAGHSFGALVALALAEQRPELVRAAVAYEGPKSWASWWPGAAATVAAGEPAPEDTAEWFMRRMIGDVMWDRLPESMRAERRAEGPTLVAEMRSVRPPNPPPFEPSAITVPVLAAFGGETRPHHMRATDELAGAVPRGELRIVEGAGHGAHLSHPAAFADLVRRALELASEPV
jgi:pimeloyl-ACP methyl ester carboxylesterase